MSLNNIELPVSIIADLYGNTLVLIPGSGSTPPRPAAIPVNPAATPTSAPATTAPPAKQPTPPAVAAATPTASPGLVLPIYKFLGSNQKKITILVDCPQIPFLPDDQLAFLSKMLEACKMNMGDVAIVNQAAAPVEIGLLKRQLSPAFFLFFGPGPEDIGLPIQFPLFKMQAYDQCTFLCAPSLAQLVQPGDENKLLKSKLWVCLKTLFEI